MRIGEDGDAEGSVAGDINGELEREPLGELESEPLGELEDEPDDKEFPSFWSGDIIAVVKEMLEWNYNLFREWDAIKSNAEGTTTGEAAKAKKKTKRKKGKRVKRSGNVEQRKAKR